MECLKEGSREDYSNQNIKASDDHYTSRRSSDSKSRSSTSGVFEDTQEGIQTDGYADYAASWWWGWISQEDQQELDRNQKGYRILHAAG